MGEIMTDVKTEGLTLLGVLFVTLPPFAAAAYAGYWVLAHVMAWLFEGITLNALPLI